MRPLSFVLFRFVSFRVISCHVFLRPCIHALILPCHPLFSDCFTDFTCSHADFISSHPPFARSFVHLERATPSTHCVCRRLSYKPPILLMVIVLFILFSEASARAWPGTAGQTSDICGNSGPDISWILQHILWPLTQPVLRHFSGHESGHIFWHLSWWHIFWRKSFWHILTYMQANAVTCALKEELLQTEAFTDRSFYTEGSFHRVVFTHRNFYTQTRFQRSFRNFIITHHTFFSLNVSTASFIIHHLFIMAHHLLSSYFPLSFDLLPPLGPHCKI